MDLKFNEFAKIIFMAESEGIMNSFYSTDPSLARVYIEWLEKSPEEREGFIMSRMDTVKAWKDQLEEVISKFSEEK